ncbi:MAG TPA: hypothetical protein VNL15_04350 [Dehalococcoidia bacterium]|nr:hypothetical protein [Dehalococcoidia bacterium]
MRKTWLFAVLGGLLAIAALGAACGDDDEVTQTATPRVAAPTSPPAQATTPAATAVTVASRSHPQLGTILTDAQGKTLYTFTPDPPNGSACTGDCAQRWPPLTLRSGTPTASSGVTGRLGTIQRTDGSTQVTYDGKPLYYFAADAAPGDANGQGVGNVWFVVKLGQ